MDIRDVEGTRGTPSHRDKSDAPMRRRRFPGPPHIPARAWNAVMAVSEPSGAMVTSGNYPAP
jgi:hypothetical protein